MKRIIFVGALALVVAGSACSPASEQATQQAAQGAEKAAAGAEQAAKGAEAAAGAAQKGMEQMMQGLQQMTKAANAGGPVKIVDYEVLKGLVPEIKGWERSSLKGQQTTMGVSVSSAEARYAKDGQRIKLEIIDTSFSQLLIAPVMMFARAGYEQKSDDGYKKGITLAGHPGFESVEKNNRNAEVGVLVANRFLVKAEGNNVDNADAVRAAVQTVDLGKLAGMK